MEVVHRTHTLRVCSERSSVDANTLPLDKEKPMIALIRLLSRYILISG